VPVQSTLTRVIFINQKLGRAVGHDATILHSKDGGDSWDIQQYLPNLEKPLFDVIFKDENQGVAIGAYGQFFRTSNGGETWVPEFHSELLVQDDIDYLNELKAEDEEAYLDEIASILPHFNRFTRVDQTLFLAGEIGLLAKSNDFGISWRQVDEIYNGSFFDISSTQDGNLLVAGLRGNIFRSSENISQWQASKNHTTALLSAIVKSSDQRIFILGNNGVLLESHDDGRSFVLHQQPDGKALISGVWFNNKLIATSEIGIKILTTAQTNSQSVESQVADKINSAGIKK
jgi:photosystem II stability/assembly factor-like uncharacterized protein